MTHDPATEGDVMPAELPCEHLVIDCEMTSKTEARCKCGVRFELNPDAGPNGPNFRLAAPPPPDTAESDGKCPTGFPKFVNDIVNQLIADKITALTAERDRLRLLHQELVSAALDGSADPNDPLEHVHAVNRIRQLVDDPSERWVEERNCGAEQVARMILEGATGEGMSDGPIRQALAMVARLREEHSRLQHRVSLFADYRDCIELSGAIAEAVENYDSDDLPEVITPYLKPIIGERDRLRELLDSSFVITPKRIEREDAWGRVKRIMEKKPPLTADEVGVIVWCLEDSMREEMELADQMAKLERVAEAARDVCLSVYDEFWRAIERMKVPLREYYGDDAIRQPGNDGSPRRPQATGDSMTPEERVRYDDYLQAPVVSVAGNLVQANVVGIRLAITEAVAAERERCAKVADDIAEDLRRQANEIDADDEPGAGDNCREHAEEAERIASHIRAGDRT